MRRCVPALMPRPQRSFSVSPKRRLKSGRLRPSAKSVGHRRSIFKGCRMAHVQASSITTLTSRRPARVSPPRHFFCTRQSRGITSRLASRRNKPACRPFGALAVRLLLAKAGAFTARCSGRKWGCMTTPGNGLGACLLKCGVRCVWWSTPAFTARAGVVSRPLPTSWKMCHRARRSLSRRSSATLPFPAKRSATRLAN